MKKKVFLSLFIAVLGIAVFVGCGSNNGKETTEDSKEETKEETTDGVRTVKIGMPQNGVPYGYVDDDGNPTGYDIEVLKLVDEKLEDYEFEYVPTSDQDAWTGAEQGKYQVAVTNSFYTAERAEKYIIPETNLGASIGVLIYRKGEGPYTSWADVASSGASLVPIKAGDGWQFLVEDYNAKNPDNTIKLELTDDENWLAGLGYVAEGRYDVFGTILSSWTENVEAEDGDYHNLYDQLEVKQFTSVKTYTLVNKNETDLADKINEALKELHKSGKTEEVSQQFYGYNVMEYLED